MVSPYALFFNGMIWRFSIPYFWFNTHMIEGMGTDRRCTSRLIGDFQRVLLANIQSLRMMLRHVTMFLTQILIAMEGYSGIDMLVSIPMHFVLMWMWSPMMKVTYAASNLPVHILFIVRFYRFIFNVDAIHGKQWTLLISFPKDLRYICRHTSLKPLTAKMVELTFVCESWSFRILRSRRSCSF